MKVDINLNDFLRLEENGVISFEDDRSILISISAFGTLRRDLIKNIGQERMKGFLVRYGWDLGTEDGKKVLKKQVLIRDAIKYGPIIHRMKGNAMVETTKLDLTTKNGITSVHMEGIWKRSYEAEEHVRQFGLTNTPVCYTLIGYASGYLSKICNQTVIFQEVSCQAQGHTECKWVGKSINLWNGEVDDEIQYYQESPIVKELEMTYEKLLEDRNNLEKSTMIHRKLTEEILQGNNLESIANVVYEATNIPLLISEINHLPLAYSGLSEKQVILVNEEFTSYFEEQALRNEHNGQKLLSFHQVKLIKLKHHSRHFTPIYLQNKIIGYCSFIYINHQIKNYQINNMILERIASVSSIYLLKEKTKFEANQRMLGHFLDEILRCEYQEEEEIIRRGRFLHLDLTEPYRMAVVKYHLKENDFKKKLAFHEKVLEATTSYFNKQDNMLITHRANSVILLVSSSQLMKEDLNSYCERFLDFLSDTLPSVQFFVGISNERTQISEAKECYQEARISLRMCSSNDRILSFESLGLIGPLINQNNEKEIKKIALKILGPLLENLDNKKLDLVNTLYLYLLNGGNLEKTAAENALSLSGVRYRLSKIEDLIGQDLRNPFFSYQLLFALQTLILIGEIELTIVR